MSAKGLRCCAACAASWCACDAWRWRHKWGCCLHPMPLIPLPAPQTTQSHPCAHTQCSTPPLKPIPPLAPAQAPKNYAVAWSRSPSPRSPHLVPAWQLARRARLLGLSRGLAGRLRLLAPHVGLLRGRREGGGGPQGGRWWWWCDGGWLVGYTWAEGGAGRIKPQPTQRRQQPQLAGCAPPCCTS